MLKKSIEVNGEIYILKNVIRENKNTYVEYRNEEIKKMKILKLENGKLEKINDQEELNMILEKNYILKDII